MEEKLSFIVEASADITQFIPYNTEYIGERSDQNQHLFRHPEDFFIALAGNKKAGRAGGPVIPRSFIGLDYAKKRRLRTRWETNPATGVFENMEKAEAPQILPHIRAKSFLGRNAGYKEDVAWRGLREAFYTRFYPEAIIESGGTVLLHPTSNNWATKTRTYTPPPIDLDAVRDPHSLLHNGGGGGNTFYQANQLKKIREKYGIGDEHPPKWYPAHQFENALFNVVSLYDETFAKSAKSTMTGRLIKPTYSGRSLFTSLRGIFKRYPDYRVTDSRSDEWKTQHLAQLKDGIAAFRTGEHEKLRDKVWDHLASMGFTENPRSTEEQNMNSSYNDSQSESLTNSQVFNKERGSMLLLPDRNSPRGIVVHHDYSISPTGVDTSRIRIIGYNGKVRMSPIILPMDDLNKITTTIQDLSTKLSNSRSNKEFIHTGLAREVRDREDPGARIFNLDNEDQRSVNGWYNGRNTKSFIFNREAAERMSKPINLDLGSSPEEFRSNFLRQNL